jgi:glutathione S-transferase
MRHHQMEFEEKWVSLFVETTEAELAEYNSDYKVPVLKDGDLLVWDSLAILEYVSEAHLDGKGWPRDRRARAMARSISSEMHSSFANVRNEMPMNCRKHFDGIKLSQEAKREVERIKSLWRMCRGEFAKAGDWLFGEYTIADAMYAPIALRFHGYGIPLSGPEADYVACVLSQPEMREWIDDGKLETQIIEANEIRTFT